MKKRHQNIGIVASPFSFSKPTSTPLSHLVNILHHTSSKLYIIIGSEWKALFKEDDEIYISEIQHKSGTNLFTRIVNYIHTQLKLSFRLAKLSKSVDLWIFFIGAEGLALPVLTARLLRRRAVLALAGSPTTMNKARKDFLVRITDLSARLNLALSSRITVCSERNITEYGLEKYRNKISIAHLFLGDFDKFKLQKPLHERENLVGYIGRFSEVKGILNFIEALPQVLDGIGNIKFLIGGDGQLGDRAKEYLTRENLNSKVNFVGWIPHDRLPKYLNDLKLLVLPSYSEGMPFIMGEAMACGTPVLATAVGAIPEVIKDNETGFIMEDNSPQCIAKNIIRALEHPNLEQITKNARVLIEKEYTFEAAVEGYKNILISLE